MNTEYKKRSYDGNETIIRVGLLFECCDKFGEVWVHFHNAVEIFGIDFINPRMNFVRMCIYEIIPKTHGSSLGNAAHMAAFMSKKGLMERGIHRATCRKVSTASDDLVMDKARNMVSHCDIPITLRILREHFIEDKGDHFGAGSRRHGGGMVVVRRKEGISS